MSFSFWFVVTTLIFSSSEVFSSQAKKMVLPLSDVSAQKYFLLFNQYRIELGLKPLKYLDSIAVTAGIHTRQMAARKRPFGHMGWLYRCRYLSQKHRANHCGEIVAMGQKNESAVLEAWINSPDHREAVEYPDWTHTGLGISVNSKGRIYWSQMFLTIPRDGE